MADHLSRIPNAPIEITPINEDFPDEHIYLYVTSLGMQIL